MALSTFGAIMGFAAEMAGQARADLRGVDSEKPKNPELKRCCNSWLMRKGRTMR